MSQAQKLVDRWKDDTTECPSVEAWAKEVDPRCRIEGFLYSDAKRIVFPDGSVATYTNSCLIIGKAR